MASGFSINGCLHSKKNSLDKNKTKLTSQEITVAVTSTARHDSGEPPLLLLDQEKTKRGSARRVKL